MILWLLPLIKTADWSERLLSVFLTGLYLRQLISYSVRVVNITANELDLMEDAGINFVKLQALKSSLPVTPSSWTLGHVAAKHAKHCFEKHGLGLGCNSMEGREQKHQKIKTECGRSSFKKPKTKYSNIN